MSDVYLNGEFVERDVAAVSAFDRGVLYGDGLFETVRAYGGQPFDLGEHLARLAGSAAFLGIPFPGREPIAGAVRELIDRNGLGDAYVRVTLTRGEHTGALVPDEPGEPTVLVEARELHPYPAELYERGADVIVSSLAHDSRSPLRAHKTTNYLLSIVAKREAAGRGALEAVLLDPAGHVCECATSNIFCVRGGALFTPPLDLNILPGITRSRVIELARAGGTAVREERFTADDLRAADEAFVTNSLMEVLPVRSVGGVRLSAAPGPVTRSLRAAYRGLVPRGT
ncbi:MAG: aminotransferase class IV [Planctomycetota bacterium]